MPKSNLVIQTAFLGDLILAVPTLRRIKNILPEEPLIVLCKKGLGQFLIQQKIADQIIEIEKSNSESYSQALSLISQIEVRNLYCIHRSIRSAFFSARIKADKKIGFSSVVGFFIFDDLIDFRPAAPEAIRQFGILETSDEKTFHELNTKEFEYLNTSDLKEVPDFFSFKPVTAKKPSLKKKIAIFPGSVWATKKWTQDGFTELARLLTADNYQVDLMGAESEKKLCEEIAVKAIQANVLAGKFSVSETLTALADYDLVIANDSAPTHMAAYNNTPVISIFGPTTLRQGFRPWSNNSRVIENKELSCRPCGRHGHNECPLKHHNCMISITATEVYLQAVKLLQS